MIDIIIIIFVIVYICKKLSSKSPKNLLYRVLSVQRFTNIREIPFDTELSFITADAKGENFLFAVKNYNSAITKNFIDKIVRKSQQLHRHNIILVVSNLTDDVTITKYLKVNNIKVWDTTTLMSFLDSNIDNENVYTNKPISNSQILSTSDTSDDTCKIESSSYNPIQEGEGKVLSIFSGLFDKPDQL